MPYGSAARRLLPLVVLALLAFVAPTSAGFAQERTAPDGRLSVEEYAVAVAAPEPPAAQAVAPQAGPVRTFLPIARAPARVIIQFASSVDSNGDLVSPTTTFTYGITKLYYQVTFFGAGGQTYLKRWTINGKVGIVPDSNGTVFSNADALGGYIYYTNGARLDRGTYALSIQLNGLPFAQSTAVIK